MSALTGNSFPKRHPSLRRGSEYKIQHYFMKRTNQEEKAMNNIPKVKIGIVAVSRDCFPESLSVNRRKALVDAYKAKYDAEDIY